MVKLNIAIMRSTKTLSQINGDVLAWFSIRIITIAEEAQRRLNERIEAKLNDNTPTTLKSLTFHVACDEWFQNYIKTSRSKRTTIKTKLSKLNTLKKV